MESTTNANGSFGVTSLNNGDTVTVECVFSEPVITPSLVIAPLSAPTTPIQLNNNFRTLDGGKTWTVTFTISRTNPAVSGDLSTVLSYFDLAGNPSDTIIPSVQLAPGTTMPLHYCIGFFQRRVLYPCYISVRPAEAILISEFVTSSSSGQPTATTNDRITFQFKSNTPLNVLNQASSTKLTFYSVEDQRPILELKARLWELPGLVYQSSFVVSADNVLYDGPVLYRLQAVEVGGSSSLVAGTMNVNVGECLLYHPPASLISS